MDLPTRLDYATVEAGTRPPRLLLLASTNVASAALSLLFVPLIQHIRMCTGVEWCHVAAFLYGAPAALVTAVLLAATVAWGGGSGRDLRLLFRFGVLLPLLLPVAILAALFEAVFSN